MRGLLRSPASLTLALAAAGMVALMLWSSAALADAEAEATRFRVMVRADQQERDAIAGRGIDIAGHELEENRVEVIVGRDDLAWLAVQGFAFEVLEVRDAPRPLYDEAPDVPLADDRYTSPAEMELFLAQVHADHPTITRLETIGTSHQGRPIQALLISDNAADDEDELSILFNGAHHAREVMTPEIVMDTIDQLTDLYGVDPEMTERVDSFAIWCVPIVNPDGVARVHEIDDYWRKNTRDNDSSGTITSQDGVDLNRNYEWGWGGQCNGSSGTISSETYRGPTEGSEPEAQAMIALGRRISPVFDVEYHSYGEDVFYAMSCDPQFSPKLTTVSGDGSISRVVAQDYAARIVQADGGSGYSAASYGSRVDGTGRDQQYSESGAIAFVVEVNSSFEGGFHPDYGVYRQPTVEGHRPAWTWLIDRMTGPAIGGVVTDAVSGLPVAADISLDEMQLPDGKRLTSRADTGRYHVIVVPGSYTLRVSAEGYEPMVVPVTAGSTWLPSDVALVPTGSSRIVVEDFESAASVAAWTAGASGDNANDGLWEWGEPNGTHTGDVIVGTLEFSAPRFDASSGEGHRAFVTGNEATTLIDTDDVDKGRTTLLSPPYDLSGLYGVSVSFLRWLRADPATSQDGLETAVSADGGQSWVVLESLSETTATSDASPAWTAVSFRLDELIAPGPDVRFRFVAEDAGAEHVVEAGVDDFELRGFSLSVQGDVRGVEVSGPGQTVVSWQPVPGGDGAVYDVVRGELGALGSGGSGVSLGALTCIEDDSTDTDSAGSPDGFAPAPGSGVYYLVRFQLGFSVGGFGSASAGGERSGSGGCS